MPTSSHFDPQLPATVVPEWDMADRLRKALRVADMHVSDMADYLGITRETVGRYINGHAGENVPLQTLRLWSLRTGVPLQWIQTGTVDDPPNGKGSPAPRPAGKRRRPRARRPA